MSGLAADFGFDQPSTARPRSSARWVLSLVVVLALHGLIAAGLAIRSAQRPAAGSDVPTVLIDMAPPPAASSDVPTPTPPSVAEPVSSAPIPTLDPTPLPEVAPDIPQPLAEAVLSPEAPTPAAVETPMPVEAPPAPVPKDAVIVPPPPKKVAAKPPPQPKPRVAERKPPRPVQAEARGDFRPSRRPPADAAGAHTTAATPSTSSGNSAASKSLWQSQLVAYLQRNLRYPSGTGNGGAAAVTFQIDRHGRVLGARIARSAGSTELDAAALATFIGTLPPAPPDVAGATFAFTIPIRFNRL